jgi:NADP-dependent 3-hydroxy acid dehydrogenase YdfG
VLPVLIESKGNIVNVSSTSATKPTPNRWVRGDHEIDAGPK